MSTAPSCCTATIGEPADDAEAAADRELGEHGAAVVAVAAVEHAGEPVVATGGADGTLALWRSAAGWSSVRLQAHSGGVRAVAMTTRDSALAVVSAGDDGRVVRHLDAASDPSPAPALKGHDGPVRALAISVLDGRPAIVSGGEDGTVRLWDLRDGRPLGEPLRGHRGAVRALATGALDGRPIAVSVADDYPRLWDLRAAREVGEPWREQRDATHDPDRRFGRAGRAAARPARRRPAGRHPRHPRRRPRPEPAGGLRRPGTGWFGAVAAKAGPGKTIAVVGDAAAGLLAALAPKHLGTAQITASAATSRDSAWRASTAPPTSSKTAATPACLRSRSSPADSLRTRGRGRRQSPTTEP